jgi:putative ABC transport system permease protein
MIDSLYIAWHYIAFYKIRTLILVACIVLIGGLPLALDIILKESEQQLRSRAFSTPLVLGAKGSALDLVMNSLYYTDAAPEFINISVAREVADTQMAQPIPIYVGFKARGYPIVGTTLDYFDFRGLELVEGRPFARLGEVVVGQELVTKLRTGVGDSIVSSPETVFDLAGVYPLKMKIVGILKETWSPDDRAIFVDIKTAWVIQGLGHGHEDLAKIKDQSVIISRDDKFVTANTKLFQYTEITEDNVNSFHFHGDQSEYPVTAIIAVPNDTKSGTVLRGRYIDNKSYQVFPPKDIVDDLLESIFRVKAIIDTVIVIVGFATLLAIVFIFVLTLRVRRREMQTIFKLGCQRSTMVNLVGAEVVIIILFSGIVIAGLMGVVSTYSPEIARAVVLN